MFDNNFCPLKMPDIIDTMKVENFDRFSSPTNRHVKHDEATSKLRTTIATRSGRFAPSHQNVLNMHKQVINQIGCENSKRVICRRDSFSSQYSLEVLGSKPGRKSEEVEKEKNVCKAQENADEHTNLIRDVINPKEDAANERRGRDQDGETLYVIERIKLFTIGTAFGLKVQCHDQDERGQNCLNVESEFIRENDDNCKNGFSEHDHGLPEDVSFAVGSIDEAADFVDPAILVVSCNLLDNQECDREWKPNSEDDEEWPCQQMSQRGMRSLVALNAGVHCPVVRCLVDPRHR